MSDNNSPPTNSDQSKNVSRRKAIKMGLTWGALAGPVASANYMLSERKKYDLSQHGDMAELQKDTALTGTTAASAAFALGVGTSIVQPNRVAEETDQKKVPFKEQALETHASANEVNTISDNPYQAPSTDFPMSTPVRRSEFLAGITGSVIGGITTGTIGHMSPPRLQGNSTVARKNTPAETVIDAESGALIGGVAGVMIARRRNKQNEDRSKG